MIFNTMSAWIIIFLSFFLNNGQITEVESKKGFGPGEQEWGYVKVRESAHMFWWLYYVNPSVKSDNFSVFTKPLIIWIQGGPGSSSTGYGNFAEFGPLNLDLQERNHTWVNDYNVLFIDNPVGSGFSYVESNSSYPTNNLQIAEDLLICIKRFFEVIPEFQNVSTYIASESYGGKMASEFALLWYQAQSKDKIKSKLKSVILSDAWISPVDSVLSWAPYLRNLGMIDKSGYIRVKYLAKKTKQAVESKNWTLAAIHCAVAEKYIESYTEGLNFYNILEKDDFLAAENKKLDVFMNSKVKEALGLNATWHARELMVLTALIDDFMKPVTNIVERLLNETNLQVLVLNGQLDLIVSTPGTYAWVKKLKWPGAMMWCNSTRKAISVNNVIEGYVKEHGNLKMYWINRAGHTVLRDNPDAANIILQDLTSQILCNTTDTYTNNTDVNNDTLPHVPHKKSLRKNKVFPS